MNDISANNEFCKSLEDSLTRMFSIFKDEISLEDLTYMTKLLNRLVPDKKCISFNFDENTHKGVSVLPTFDEVSNIGRSLFNFDSKDKIYTPVNYVVNVSPSCKYNSIKEIVALILLGIDNLSCPLKLLELKAMLIDKIIEKDALAGSKTVVFKGNAGYNINLTAIILPTIMELYESEKNYFKKDKLLDYLTNTEMKDSEKDSNLVKYGYYSELPIMDNEEKDKESKIIFRNILNNTLDNIFDYPANKSLLLNMYKRVLDNPTSGNFEKELATKSIECLKKANGNIFDNSLKEKFISESVRSTIEMRKKGYSDLEIGELEVELEDLRYSEDKMYLITRIHRDLQIAHKIKAKKKDYEQELINDYILQLKELLDKVKAKKVKTEANDFKITVQYPADDYEN